MATYLPEVNQMAQKLTAANGYLPMVADAGQLAVDVRSKLPEVQQAGAQLNTVTTNFGQLESAVTKAVGVTSQGIIVVNQVDGTLPALTDFGKNAQAAIGTTKDEVLPKVSTALDVVQNAVDAGLTLIAAANTSLSADLTTLQNQLQQLATSSDTAAIKQAMVARLTALADRQGKVAANATSLADTLTRLQASLNKLTGKDDQPLAGAITRLRDVATTATAVQTAASDLAKDVPNLSTNELQSRLATLNDVAQKFASDANTLKDLDLGTSVKQVLNAFKTALADAATTLTKINDQVLPELPSLLSGTKDLLTQANTFLVKTQKQLPALKQELTDANTLLNGHMNLITSGITTVADLYQNDFPSLKTKLTKATNFINQDLPGVESDLTSTLALANEKCRNYKAGWMMRKP